VDFRAGSQPDKLAMNNAGPTVQNHAADLEAAYDKDRLVALVKAGGREAA